MAATVTALKQHLRKSMRSAVAQLSAAEVTAQSAAVAKQLAATDWFARSRAVCVFVSMPHGELQTRPVLDAIFAAGKRCFVPRIDFDAPPTSAALATGAPVAAAADAKAATAASVTVDIKQPAAKAKGSAKAFAAASSSMRLLECFGAADLDGFVRNRWHIPEPPLTYVDVTTPHPHAHRPRPDALHCAELDLVIVPGAAFGLLPDGRALRCGHGRGYYDRWLTQLRDARRARATSASTSAALGLGGTAVPAGAGTGAGTVAAAAAAAAASAMPRIVGVGLAPQFVSASQIPTEAHDFVLDAAVGPVASPL